MTVLDALNDARARASGRDAERTAPEPGDEGNTSHFGGRVVEKRET